MLKSNSFSKQPCSSITPFCNDWIFTHPRPSSWLKPYLSYFQYDGRKRSFWKVARVRCCHNGGGPYQEIYGSVKGGIRTLCSVTQERQEDSRRDPSPEVKAALELPVPKIGRKKCLALTTHAMAFGYNSLSWDAILSTSTHFLLFLCMHAGHSACLLPVDKHSRHRDGTFISLCLSLWALCHRVL